MAKTTVFRPDRVRQLQRELEQVADSTNLLRQQINGKANSWSGDLPIWGALQSAQQSITRLTDDVERLAEVVRQAIEGMERIEQENKRGATVWWDKVQLLTSLLARFGQQAVRSYAEIPEEMRHGVRRLIDRVEDWRRPDRFDQEPAVQQLRELLASVNLPPADRVRITAQLEEMYAQRELIAKAQRAYEMYKQYGNTAQMLRVHQLAEDSRLRLIAMGIQEQTIAANVDLTPYYAGSAVQACAFDPLYTKPIPIMDSEKYRTLLMLGMKQGATGTWARKQLEEIVFHREQMTRSMTSVVTHLQDGKLAMKDMSLMLMSTLKLGTYQLFPQPKSIEKNPPPSTAEKRAWYSDVLTGLNIGMKALKIKANAFAAEAGEFMGKDHLEFKGIGINIANEIIDWGQEKIAKGEQWVYEQMDTLRDKSVGGIRLAEIPYYIPGNPIAPIYQMAKLFGHEEKVIHFQTGLGKGVVGGVFDIVQLAVDVVQRPLEVEQYVTETLLSDDPKAKLLRDSLQEVERLKAAPAALQNYIEDSYVDIVNASPEKQSELAGILVMNIALMFVGAGELKLIKGIDDMMSKTWKILAEAEVKDVKPSIGGLDKPKVDPVPETKGMGKAISEADKLKLSQWKYRPSDELYIQYKHVFDNPKYYDQTSGDIKWPINDGFEGISKEVTLREGTRIDRYGYESGTFVSPEGIPYEMRSLAPGTNNKPYHIYEVLKPIDGLEGKIAPWFDEVGGGVQYKLTKSIQELIDEGYLREVFK